MMAKIIFETGDIVRFNRESNYRFGVCINNRECMTFPNEQLDNAVKFSKIEEIPRDSLPVSFKYDVPVRFMALFTAIITLAKFKNKSNKSD